MQTTQTDLVLKLIEDTTFSKAAKEILSIAKILSSSGLPEDLNRSDNLAEFAEKLYQTQKPHRLTVDMEKQVEALSAKIDKCLETFNFSLDAVFSYFQDLESISETVENQRLNFFHPEKQDHHTEIVRFFSNLENGKPPTYAEWPDILNAMTEQIALYCSLSRKDHALHVNRNRAIHIKQGMFYKFVELKNLSKLHLTHLKTIKKEVAHYEELQNNRNSLYVEIGFNSNVSYPLKWDFEDLAGIRSTRRLSPWEYLAEQRTDSFPKR